MKVVIIEDEKPALDKLRNALGKCDRDILVVSELKSIHDATSWFRENGMPDLVFMDIELSDGLSFKIFDETTITCPIIFTTAYDDYWQEALNITALITCSNQLNRKSWMQLSRNMKHYKNILPRTSSNCCRKNPWETD